MDYLFAKANCVVVWNEFKVVIHNGEAWHASDPFVKANPHLFAAAPTIVKGHPAVSKPVESASAEPGEKRTTRRTKNA